MKKIGKAIACMSALALAMSLNPATALAKKGDLGGAAQVTPQFSIEVPGGLADGVYSAVVTVQPDKNEDFPAYDLTVYVTVSNGVVTGLECVGGEAADQSYNENARVGILSQLAGANATTSVDSVSGATCTSKVLAEGISAALASGSTSESEAVDYANMTVSTWDELGYALARAQSGATITLAADLVVTADEHPLDAVSSATVEQIGVRTKPVTIDGAGHTISCEEGSTGFCFDFQGGDEGIVVKDVVFDGGSYGFKCGGALYITNGLTTLENVVLKNCKAYSSGAGNGGGAIYVEGGGELVARNCTFEGNEALNGTDDSVLFGGAAFAWNSPMTFENCTFANNVAYEGGAVCMTGNGVLTISDCTFENNKATNVSAEGAGVGDDVAYYDGVAYFKHGVSSAGGTLVLEGDNSFSDEGSVVLARYYGVDAAASAAAEEMSEVAAGREGASEGSAGGRESASGESAAGREGADESAGGKESASGKESAGGKEEASGDSATSGKGADELGDAQLVEAKMQDVAPDGVRDMIFGDVLHTTSVSEALTAALQSAHEMSEDDFTTMSWAPFAEVMKTAEGIDVDAVEGVYAVDASTLDSLYEACSVAAELSQAEDELVKLVGRDALELLVEKSQAAYDNPDEWFPDRQGADENKEALASAFEDAQELLGNSAASKDDLSNAFYALYTVLAKSDLFTDELADEINEALSVDEPAAEQTPWGLPVAVLCIVVIAGVLLVVDRRRASRK